jgi:hypothetical protein
LREAKESLRKKEDVEVNLRQELEEAKEALSSKTQELLKISEARNALQRKVSTCASSQLVDLRQVCGVALTLLLWIGIDCCR